MMFLKVLMLLRHVNFKNALFAAIVIFQVKN